MELKPGMILILKKESIRNARHVEEWSEIVSQRRVKITRTPDTLGWIPIEFIPPFRWSGHEYHFKDLKPECFVGATLVNKPMIYLYKGEIKDEE